MYMDGHGNPWIKISDINVQAYCEYQLKFSWQGIDPKTEAMLVGSLRHAELETAHTERMKDAPKVSVEEALRLGVKGSGRELRIKSGRHFLYGKIDEVQFEPNAIFIIDDKPSGNVYLSAMNQARAYSLAFSSEYAPDKPVFSAVRDRNTGEALWMEEFTGEVQSKIIEVVQRIRSLAKGEIDFISTTKPFKCRPCRFNSICDRKLI
ncbi:MAG TPA: PD-(D/E)XK nuclease family protein [archaeon]|nr:PD-(D/E)XK nuclease family protein [archaeon]